MSGWEREWGYVQEQANAPRTPTLGCSTVSHDRLGFCAFCVPVSRDSVLAGVDLELGAWRLLAMKKENATDSPRLQELLGAEAWWVTMAPAQRVAVWKDNQ